MRIKGFNPSEKLTVSERVLAGLTVTANFLLLAVIWPNLILVLAVTPTLPPPPPPPI